MPTEWLKWTHGDFVCIVAKQDGGGSSIPKMKKHLKEFISPLLSKCKGWIKMKWGLQVIVKVIIENLG